MSEISAAAVNELRQRTGAGFIDCKKALLETNGNAEEAIVILKKRGIASAAKKAGRETHEGVIESYIHTGGRVGVLLELDCETDFVAKNEEFKRLAKDICMHIAASNPVYLARDFVPLAAIDQEREIAAAQVEGKPQNVKDKIVEGKIEKWFAQVCLLEQAFVKNQELSVQAHIAAVVAHLGENLQIRRFVRYQIGE